MSAVSIGPRLRAGRPGFDFWQDQGFSSLPPHPVRVGGPSRLLSSGYRELFPWSKAARACSWPLVSI